MSNLKNVPEAIIQIKSDYKGIKALIVQLQALFGQNNSKSETLTNKTLSGATNNLLEIPVSAIDIDDIEVVDLDSFARKDELQNAIIQTATEHPAIGNIHIDPATNKLFFKSGNSWYEVAIAGSVAAVSSLRTGLVAYYALNETAGAVLDALNLHNGTPSADSPTRGVAGQTGKGTAYEFNGATQFVVFSGNVLTSPTFTIACYIRTSINTNQVIFTGGVTNSPVFRVADDGRLNLLSRAHAVVGVSSITVNDGTWKHVAVTFDAEGVCTFYINAMPAGSDTNPQTWAFGDNDVLGSAISSEHFSGGIQHLLIANRALSAAEVAEAMNSTYPFS